MLRTDLADQLRSRQDPPGYHHPAYESYSFHRIPGSLAAQLGVDVGPTLPDEVFSGPTGTDDSGTDVSGTDEAGADASGIDDSALPADPSTVVLLFIDAYGWNAFERTHDDLPFFRQIGTKATVTPLTSIFPSETGACIPTIHTGRVPIEHGLLGWDAYDPAADVVYSALPYRATDGGDLEVSRDDLFDGEQVYAKLQKAGVDTHNVSPAEHGDSGVRVDWSFHGYSGLGEFATTLRETIGAADDPGYVFAYYPGIDGVAHRRGPESPAHDAQLAALGAVLERELGRVDDPESVLLCLVADHGQVAARPDQAGQFPEVVLEAVRRDRAGTPVVTGSPRNLHLHLRDGADPETVRDSSAAGISPDHTAPLVFTREEALDQGLWGSGDPLGPAFERNCGDVIVVPERDALWWTLDDPSVGFKGLHGGLHEDELLVPFAPVRLSAIV